MYVCLLWLEIFRKYTDHIHTHTHTHTHIHTHIHTHSIMDLPCTCSPQLPYQEPLSSPTTLSPDSSYASLLEKYNKRGKEIKSLKKIIQQLEEELKQTKAEVLIRESTSCVCSCLDVFSWRQFEVVKTFQVQVIQDMRE